MKLAKTTLALAILLAIPQMRALVADAQTPSARDSQVDRKGGVQSYAQYLVDSYARRHAELVGIELHAALPGGQSTIVASRTPALVGTPPARKTWPCSALDGQWSRSTARATKTSR